MKVSFRPANLMDAPLLLEIRRDAIAVLAPRGMPRASAAAWAENLTLSGMKQKLRDLDIWIAEVNEQPIAWGAIRGAHLEGLYTRAVFSGRGIGTQLLNVLEGLVRERGYAQVHAEASQNAEGFYLGRGYVRGGAPTAENGLPIVKRLAV